ncbi:hypothetical protein SD70_14910 [Gordoniibacillus kamchatkensis]|uniref:HEAT repeat domain-containing protein n=1 Tax=Gordoniibacillus kamchatkensis TaxID=1590651 RepID=A0ABR5AGR5_9BACL|nr:hypothetical protein [Paenibacillus sp. VKM B-2647]KIL40243.1 hypothetical protein SD70_14910 [Paenibacillus sp. VKM B-2647]
MLLKQFRYDLACGLGSIILYLKQSPKLTNKYIDAIYNACIKNTAYDPQCDISREDYLWEIIQLSQESESLQERILSALESSIDGWDLCQVYRLAKIFALNGNSTALSAMMRGFRYHEEWNSFIGGEEIIQAEGEQGFLFVASRIGEQILSSDYEEDKFLLEFAKEQLGEEKVAALLENQCDTNIRAFMQSAGHHRWETQSKPIHSVTYDELKTSIGSAPGALYRYIRWGMRASKEDLLRAANDLLEEKNSKKLIAYLYIFGKTAFPLDPQKMIDLAHSKNRRLRSAAVAALSNIKEERIHQIGIQLITKRSTEIDALDLFIHNYSEDDLHLLEGIVFGNHNKDSFHDVGFSILKIFANNPTPSCCKILAELYKKGLCTHCRMRCIEIMMYNHILPTSIRNEIRYDCNPDIRELWIKNSSVGLP